MKKIYTLVIVLLLLTVVINPADAANKFGAKAYGMGGAFTAVADDSSAIYWNPAGLTQSGLFGLQANLGAKFNGDDLEEIQDFIDSIDTVENAGTDLEKIQAVKNLDFPKDTKLDLDGMLTLNLNSLGLGMISNSHFETSAQGDVSENSSFSRGASNKVIGEGIISLGTNIVEPPLNIGSIALGMNAKYLYGRYDRVSYTYDGSTTFTEEEINTDATGYGLDAGALIKVTDMVNIGLSVRNVVSELDWEDDYGLEDELERIVTLGAAAKLPYPIAATVAADVEMPEGADDYIYHLGLEKRIIANLISLRLGAYEQSGEDRIYTGGLGINLPFIDMNIAADTDDYVSLSGTFKF
ncbi:PorV/PorQ family protein [Orenia marismortui]|uniref:hypothetical protein n=1 Tax=Orenia marismortui TaxID=46469 RepID=UPI00036B902A|nr:hypothetical protein [Orenia marismortui]